MDETKVNARVGIGPNKILAKQACDNFSKKNKDGIFTLDHSNIKETLWKLPIPSMFGVGSKMTKHLQRMGIQYYSSIIKEFREKKRELLRLN